MLRRLLALVLLAAAIAAPSAGCSQESVTDRAFGARVRAYLTQHPEVVAEAMQAMQARQATAEERANAAAVATHRTALERDPGDYVANPNGRITMVEFFDYHCAYCKLSAPSVVEMIRKNPDIRFVFKEFPFQTEVSTKAAVDQLVTKDQGRYVPVFTALMAERALDEEGVERILRQEGVDLARAKTPAAAAAVEEHLAANKALAREVGVDGTPAFVVDGKVIAGWDRDAIDAAIAKARKAG